MTLFFICGCYVIALFLSVQIASGQYAQMIQVNEENSMNGLAPVKTSYKLTIPAAVFIALLFTLHNVIVTQFNPNPVGDRLNYTIAFLGIRNTGSAGLNCVIGFLQRFTSNAHILFYVSTFLSMLITVAAYRISEEAAPNALFFLLITQYVFFSFSGVKQCYTNAFASLCIVLALRGHGWKDTLFSLALIALAIWFHPTGYFLIPLYLLIKIKKTWAVNIAAFFIMLATSVFFEPLLLRFASSIAPYVPNLAYKIYSYIGENAAEALQNGGSMTVLKGIPYYIIMFIGWKRRSALLDKINHYDDYLLLTGVISFIYVASIYNSWIYRLAYLLYLPVAVFFVQIMQYEEDDNNYSIVYTAVMGTCAILTLRYLAMIFLQYGGF
ncbi:MAG: EpsG family protein [Clostridia bacterium]|nr:EpsG family protein [Clostridia bacterium]